MAATKRPRTKKTTEATEAKETPAAVKASVSKQVAKVANVTTRTVDLQEEIRLRAYEFFQQRGYEHGADFEDWIRAEKEVLSRFNVAA
jgi:Protein of unknown function (DUF2934)